MKISHSMMLSMDVCEMRFYFEHNDTLKPIEYPLNVRRGIFGHKLFEEFFKAYKQGKNYDECVEALNPTLLEWGHDAEVLDAYRLVLAFGAHFFTLDFDVVEVEFNRSFAIDENLDFVYTPDLIVEWNKGPKKGRRAMWDFKFTGQYWSDNELGTFQQLPKYMLYYNKVSDVKVSNCAVVMLNTRASAGATGFGLFLMKWLNTDRKKLERIEHENIAKMAHIEYVKKNYTQEDYKRTTNTFACKMCFFAKPCAMLLNGQDISKVVKTMFEPNDYFQKNYGEL